MRSQSQSLFHKLISFHWSVRQANCCAHFTFSEFETSKMSDSFSQLKKAIHDDNLEQVKKIVLSEPQLLEKVTTKLFFQLKTSFIFILHFHLLLIQSLFFSFWFTETNWNPQNQFVRRFIYLFDIFQFFFFFFWIYSKKKTQKTKKTLKLNLLFLLFTHFHFTFSSFTDPISFFFVLIHWNKLKSSKSGRKKIHLSLWYFSILFLFLLDLFKEKDSKDKENTQTQSSLFDFYSFSFYIFIFYWSNLFFFRFDSLKQTEILKISG